MALIYFDHVTKERIILPEKEALELDKRSWRLYRWTATSGPEHPPITFPQPTTLTPPLMTAKGFGCLLHPITKLDGNLAPRYSIGKCPACAREEHLEHLKEESNDTTRTSRT